MTPVVNGLESNFTAKVDFRLLNAGFGLGQRAFNSYGLPGHPSFLILDPTGVVLWKSFGPQAEGTLTAAIDGAIATVRDSQ
ncbi:MAG: TlpA family protein disulfide reductase [Candidatus Thorarchaeota archaeon]|jgi:hypothetical protein